MGNLGNTSNNPKSGKIFQGGKPPNGTQTQQTIKPKQTANIRPAGVKPVGQLPDGAPQVQDMDYMVGYHLYMDTNAYNNYGDPFPGGQTQDVANRRHQWGLPVGDTTTAGLMDFDGMIPVSELLRGTSSQQQSAAQTAYEPDEQENGHDSGDNLDHEYEHLQKIPETEEGESGDEEEETGEASYIERNKEWVDVLDENLQKHRKNPAEKMVDAGFEMDMGELLTAVDDIIETSNHEGSIPTDTLFLDTKLFAEGIRQLQQHSMIIHTVDLRVTMAYFERWADVTIRQLLGVNIVSMCQLDPFCFHIVVDSGTAKAHIFANSPLKMGTKMEAPDKVMKQRKRYLRLPDACFNCRQRGHFARACPLENVRRAPTAPRVNGTRQDQQQGGGQTEATKNDRPAGEQRDHRGGQEGSINATEPQEDFTTVRRRTKPKFQTPEIKRTLKVDNQYGVLEDPMNNADKDEGDTEVKRDVRTKPVDTRGKEIPSANGHELKSSVGAVVPLDSVGRKKLRNLPGGVLTADSTATAILASTVGHMSGERAHQKSLEKVTSNKTSY
ncbi:hypothetical protein R1sor_024192 [Riccia sorocarpa]|uniref:CCHC-type domain-containing protein n=1 Tax=Riccia sorocarpa TaxID=122646 RepID=A0ABD3GTV9_9MARC